MVLPSNTELLRVQNVTFQHCGSKAEERGWRASQKAPSPPTLGLTFRLGNLRQAPPTCSVGPAQARSYASCILHPAKAGRAGAGACRGAHCSRRSGCGVALNAVGKEKLGLGEQDFLTSWARPAPAWPHKAPFVEGPCFCADQSQRTIAQFCGPPGPALPATPRRPKARKPGGAFL